MVTQFKILVTASFSRTLKTLAARNPEVPGVYQAMLNVLQRDPLNLSRRHPIKKLINIDVGQWRIRSGVYRLRYDVSGDTVLLHALNHRGEAYL